MRIATALLLVVTGCAAPTWHKPGSTQQDFNMDQGQCQAQAYSVSGPMNGQIGAVYNACMRGKGWQLYVDPR